MYALSGSMNHQQITYITYWSRSEANKHAVELNKSCKQLAKTSGITFLVAYISSQARLNQNILSHVDRHLPCFLLPSASCPNLLQPMPFPTFLPHWQQVAMKVLRFLHVVVLNLVSCFLSTTMPYLFFTIDSSTSFSTSDSSTFFSPANSFFHIFFRSSPFVIARDLFSSSFGFWCWSRNWCWWQCQSRCA